MRNKDLLVLNQSSSILGDLKGLKITYAIIKNLKKVGREIEIFKESQPKKYKEYEVERIKLAESMCKKDEDTKPIINNGHYSFDNIEEFKLELDKLIARYNDVIKEYNDFMESESSVVFHMVDFEDVPNDITLQQMSMIEDWIKEPKDDKSYG